jgi:putative membrane protein insertion efficiency factor
LSGSVPEYLPLDPEVLIIQPNKEALMTRRFRHLRSRHRIGRESEQTGVAAYLLIEDDEQISPLRLDAEPRLPVRRVGRVRSGKSVRLMTALIMLYQERFASKLPATCVYEPSCSEYMLLALKRYGLWRGVWLGLGRLSRCRPGLGGEDYP